jgi:hypothetical protein
MAVLAEKDIANLVLGQAGSRTPEQLVADWSTMAINEKRAVVRAYIARVILTKADPKRRRWQPIGERVQIDWTAAPASPRTKSDSLARTTDELNPVGIRISHERDERTALPHLIGRSFRLDPLLLQAGKRRINIINADRDMAITCAELVRTPVMVVGQLEHIVRFTEREEVVRRFQVPLTHDVHLPRKPKAERLIKSAAPLRISDPDHRVQESNHAPGS